ncbi:MAG: hypothetical protein R3F19_05630 [Verrucomicrobiales bacterium]
MKKPLIVIAIACLVTSSLMAHQDPSGEIRPSFQTSEGEVKVLFHVNSPGRKTQYKIAPVLEGTLGTAVEIPESEVTGLRAASPPGTWIIRDGATFVFGAEHTRKPCIFRLQENRPKLIIPKWGEQMEYWGRPHSFAVTDQHFFFLVGKMSDTTFGFGDLHLYLIDRVSLDLTHHFNVGDADGILQEPTYSPLVVVRNTVFFCWSKPNAEKRPTLVMAEVPPSGRLREHTIQKEFHWNAVVDIAATDDEALIAYDLPDSNNANSTIHLYRHRVDELPTSAVESKSEDNGKPRSESKQTSQ